MLWFSRVYREDLDEQIKNKSEEEIGYYNRNQDKTLSEMQEDYFESKGYITIYVCWTGSYPKLCQGCWRLIVNGKDYSYLIKDKKSMNTQGGYDHWVIDNYGLEDWKIVNNGLPAEYWIKDNLNWLKQITQDLKQNIKELQRKEEIDESDYIHIVDYTEQNDLDAPEIEFVDSDDLDLDMEFTHTEDPIKNKINEYCIWEVIFICVQQCDFREKSCGGCLDR